MVVGEEIQPERGKRLLVLLCCGASLDDEGGRCGGVVVCLLLNHTGQLCFFIIGVFSGVLISCATFFPKKNSCATFFIGVFYCSA